MDALAAGTLVLVVTEVLLNDVARAVSINVVVDDRGASACKTSLGNKQKSGIGKHDKTAHR
jgi:hypothetical protein